MTYSRFEAQRDICRALGLDPNRVLHLEFVLDPGRSIRVEADVDPTPEQWKALAAAVARTSPEDITCHADRVAAARRIVLEALEQRLPR